MSSPSLQSVHKSPGTFRAGTPSDHGYAQGGPVGSVVAGVTCRAACFLLREADARECRYRHAAIPDAAKDNRSRMATCAGQTAERLSTRAAPEAVFLPTFDEGDIHESESHRKAARNEPSLLQSSDVHRRQAGRGGGEVSPSTQHVATGWIAAQPERVARCQSQRGVGLICSARGCISAVRSGRQSDEAAGRAFTPKESGGCPRHLDAC